jgi:protein gp37
MSDHSAISWTNATWNPITGCSHVSAGCEHCYAETLSLRMGWSKRPWTAPNAKENVVLHPERLSQPSTWRKPRRVFVNSMSDWAHEHVPYSFVSKMFDVMYANPQHTYQLLTKRPERALKLVSRFLAQELCDSWDRVSVGYWEEGAKVSLPPHIWIGVSIEQDRWCSRADVLRCIHAPVRFLSLEPLLEPLPSLNLDGIGWVITGGESGQGFRPADPDWFRAIRDQCLAAGVPYFHKQGSGRYPGMHRELDGVGWEQYPLEGGPFPQDLVC